MIDAGIMTKDWRFMGSFQEALAATN
jgi:hypothetical protein